MNGIVLDVSQIDAFYFFFQLIFFLANIYRMIKNVLFRAHFIRHQYGDYRRPNSHPVEVWIVMVSLGQIQPPGKIQSTIRGLKMHFIHDLNEMDVTEQLRLGGAFSPALLGPTPAALVARVPAGLLHPAPAIPGAGFVRPVGTRASAMADDPLNWRI